jgi:ABC-2 type transport system ATP-binding protein
MEAVKVTGVSKTFKSGKRAVAALESVSFTVNKGEIFGLLGPNGAGKTTLISVLSGLLAPDSGSSFILGLNSKSEAKKIQQMINVISGFTGVPHALSCEEALHYYSMLYSVKGEKEKIREVVRETNIGQVMGQLAYDLSSGMKQRFLIAKGLLNDPKVIILDEPTVGLDVSSAVNVRSLIKRLRKEGRSIILTTHNMFEAEELCDRIAFINNGRIIAIGTAEELKKKIVGKMAIEINCSDAKSVLAALSKLKGVIARAQSHKLVHAEVDDYSRMKPIMKSLSSCRCEIFGVNELEPTLEETYLKIINGDNGA